ncbi:hypothetical protein [Nannocystis pusilla]|uniref:Uncharacterized protein n=1 Tax=Nannocystis pusilla TaxID=889268 RepID=A0ABS7U0S3_9BACT|nr:hypothetical protein [Nannocystis pusilla]MBZ5714026.1 hypothetical protein [Nannocystis pusilla]
MRLRSLLLISTIGLGCSTAASQGESLGNSTATATDTGTSDPSGMTSPGGSTDSPTTGVSGPTPDTSTTGLSDPTGEGPATTSDSTTGAITTTESTTTIDTGTTGETTTTTGDTETDTEAGTTTGGTTGPIGGGPCVTDEDCKLHDDCCSCYAIPVDQDDAVCDERCDQTQCQQIGIDEAKCVLGQCTTEKVDCSSDVLCDSLPPDCPPGKLPGVTGGCWSGACVPAVSCDKVPDCNACPDELLCVENQAFVFEHVCLPMPEACGGEASCGCAEEACVQPFGFCGEGAGEVDLACSCPNC